MRVEQVIDQTMESCRRKTAIVYNANRWSYADLRALVDARKSRLVKAGLSEQDRAIVWMENSPEYVATYLAVLEIGGIVVALHQQTTAEEVVRIIRHVGAAALVASPTVKRWTMSDFESLGLRFLLAGRTSIVWSIEMRDTRFRTTWRKSSIPPDRLDGLRA